jgi:tRNA1(Val) A37 N6-methylase TrmN6
MRSRPVEGPQVPFAVTDDAVLGGRLKLLQPVRGHRAGHDAILLAAAAPKSGHAVDLGAGVGAAGLALITRGAARTVTLVDIDRDLIRLAVANAERNGFADRVEAVAGDVERVARRSGLPRPAAGGADVVIMNPPFNDPETRRPSSDALRRRAHSTPDVNLQHWIGAADRTLKSGGRLVMIHRPEGIATVLTLLQDPFGAVEIIPVHARASGAAIRIIVRAQKGKRTAAVIRPAFVLAEDDARPTYEAEEVLRGAAPLDQI